MDQLVGGARTKEKQAGPAVAQLIIYSRPGCHLCEEMKAVIARVLAQEAMQGAAVTEIDISTDPALERTYGQEIPVLFIDGRKSAKYRITEDELTRKLERFDKSSAINNRVDQE